MRKTLTGLLAGLSMTLAGGVSIHAAQSEELTILWAEWDPANYLQELVNEYQAETGVKVTVETVPWPDFQTKAFTEFNAQGSAYDLVVGDSQWLGAGSTGGHYVDLTDFVDAAQSDRELWLRRQCSTTRSIRVVRVTTGRFRSKATPLGWAYRKDWFEDPNEMAAFKAKYGYDLGVPKDFKQLIDIAEFFHRPDENRYGAAIYTQNAGDAIVMGVENSIFAYGGSLGDYANYKVTGMLNSDEVGQGARGLPQALHLTARRAGATRSSPKTTRRSRRARWRWA